MRNNQKDIAEKNVVLCILTGPMGQNTQQYYTPKRSMRYIYYFSLVSQTQVKYMWIEPKICRDDVDGAKKLPASGVKEDCPPCNPGMHLNGTGESSSCVFCPVNEFSDGKAGEICCVVELLMVGDTLA